MAVEAPSLPTAGANATSLYNWQRWVHVGPGAEECEHVDQDAGTVTCENPEHFHAWVRLPNPHQWRDLRDRALAAKARRMRLMRDDGSDLNIVLEEEIERLARRGDAAREEIVEELVRQDWWKYMLAAQRDLQFEREDPDDDESPLRWEHIDDDRVQLAKLKALHENDQPKDEIRLLETRIQSFDERFEERRSAEEQPNREELAELDISALLDRLRDARVNAEGSHHFEATLEEWEWVSCTYRRPPAPGERPQAFWREPTDLADVPNRVLEAIDEAFKSLNREKGGLGQGNS